MAYVDYIATPNEAARVLRMSPESVRRKMRRGEWRYAQKADGHWLVNLTKQFPRLGIRRKV